MPVRLNSTGGGSVTLDVPATSGTFTVNLPAANGDVVVTGGGSTVQFGPGSVSAPSITFSGDTNTGIYSPAADTIAFTEGGVEGMRIDGSGNVGIGTASPATRLDVRGIVQATDGTSGVQLGDGGFMEITRTAGDPYIDFKTSGAEDYDTRIQQVSNGLSFQTGGNGSATERMRIDASGNVGIGVTNPSNRLTVFSSNTNFADTIFANNTATGTGAWGRIGFQAGSFYGFIGTDNNGLFQFYNPNNTAMMFATNNAERARITSGGEFLVGVTSGGGGNDAGRVTSRGISSRSGYNGSFSSNTINIHWTGTAQLWVDTTNVGTIAFTSDYRIKRNIETQARPALARVLQLRPVTYQMADYGNLIKASDDVREGFIAHELAEVIPSAVSGEKDAVDQLQSLKLDALCSVLVKAIQEQQAQIEELKARLAAVEAR